MPKGYIKLASLAQDPLQYRKRAKPCGSRCPCVVTFEENHFKNQHQYIIGELTSDSHHIYICDIYICMYHIYIYISFIYICDIYIYMIYIYISYISHIYINDIYIYQKIYISYVYTYHICSCFPLGFLECVRPSSSPCHA